MRARIGFVWAIAVAATTVMQGGAEPVRSRYGMVVSQESVASRVGADVLAEGGTAVDAAVATAFALAVTHPAAGNIGGGGFLVYRPATGEPVAYDFREMAPARASPTMFMKDGKYDADLHHESALSVGVPGSVAGLHAAWKAHGKLPWKRLVDPAVTLARDGFEISSGFAASLAEILPDMQRYPTTVKQFSKNGTPYAAGETFTQPELARTLSRIAEQGPAGFYEGETALLIEKEMQALGGLITREDLKNYAAKVRAPVRGHYRGYDIISMGPPSSGGTALVQMLNILEGYDLARNGYGSAANVHVIVEAMRRAFADRARYMGDPDFNPAIPVTRLLSKDYARELRRSISATRASVSAPTRFEWPRESAETTHFSVVDAERNAVAMTTTLEYGYGSRITVTGGGFLLNNEMGDFNAAPGLTTADGLIGTEPNMAMPGKRMLSSMTPTIVARDGALFMVTGSLGGRTIINTVLLTVLNAIDFGMNAQEAVDAGRFHHQWLPDQVTFEKYGLSSDTLALMTERGHKMQPRNVQGIAEVIMYDAKADMLEGGADRRDPDSGAAGVNAMRRQPATGATGFR
jgi:gamma-glutamyltranspeptidase/glutathione hydrolase